MEQSDSSVIWKVCETLKFSGLPMDIPFLGQGNIWLDYSYQPDEIKLARTIIYRAITETAQGQLTLWGYDRDLSGVFAPFAGLSSGSSNLLRLISNDQDFSLNLGYLKQQVQTAQNSVKGREESLLKYRQQLEKESKNPVEGYNLAILFLDVAELEDGLRRQLLRLVRSGPMFGVSFLIVSPAMPAWVRNAERLHTKVIRLSRGGVSVGDSGPVPYTSAEPNDIIESCDILTKTGGQGTDMLTVDFEELHSDVPYWESSSTEGLTFTIGSSGVDKIEIIMGDEMNQRHNAVITGAVGQGKSNLISVIIHSLCWRYSPRELQLYLIDFKEGVTFKPFSNISHEEYLPQARALGLESDASFCLAVLETLHKEYLRRMAKLKEYDKKSIRELRDDSKFREENPDDYMPRIVTIIDEFQMMFGEDIESGQKAAELLERSVRLFRAAGIHFILASQTLSGNMALAQRKDSIFGQVPIRIALKNSIAESQQTLGINNTAAAFLKPREAVVNLDYGEPSQNRKTMVAFADEKKLAKKRHDWWEMARSYTQPPYVFDSARRTTPADSIGTLRDLRENIRDNKDIPKAAAGIMVSVEDTPVLLPMAPDPGYNVAIIGMPDQDCNHAVGMMQSMAVSLAVQRPNGGARFIFCDFRRDNEELISSDFTALMASLGCNIETVEPEKFSETLESLNAGQDTERHVYIFGAAMDRWRFKKDLSDPPLKEYLEDWPSRNIHLIGWWIKSSSFTVQTAGYGTTDGFNSMIFLRIDERAVQSLTNPFVKWSPQENRALLSDSIQYAREIPFIPHAPVSKKDVDMFKEQVW